jgi:hypothetical protein
MHPTSEQVATSRWPKIPNFAYTATATLPAPALSDAEWRDTAPADRAQRRALRDALWSRQVTLALDPPALPVPASSVFKLPESIRVTMLYTPPSARKVEPTAQAEREAPVKQARAGKSGRQVHAAAGRKSASAKHAARAKDAKHAKHGAKGASKHAQLKPAKPAKKKVREANLKKR